MKDEQRLIEVMAEMLAELHDIKLELRRHSEMLSEHGSELKDISNHQAKTNAGLGELRLSILKLAERDSIIEDHEKRLKFIETKIAKTS